MLCTMIHCYVKNTNNINFVQIIINYIYKHHAEFVLVIELSNFLYYTEKIKEDLFPSDQEGEPDQEGFDLDDVMKEQIRAQRANREHREQIERTKQSEGGQHPE